MTHEHECRAGRCGILRASESGFFYRLCRNVLRNGRLIGVYAGSILAHFTQKRLRNLDGFDLALILFHGIHQLVVLRTVHQVGRLNHQLLYIVSYRPLQRLIHVIDALAISGQHVVDDDLRGERPANGPVRIRLLNGLLHAAYILGTAVVEGGSEADHQDFLVANLVLVQRIVLGRIPRILAKIIRVRILSLDQFLLILGQRIPGIFGFFALLLRVFRPILHIDGIDFLCHFIRLVLIGFAASRQCQRTGYCGQKHPQHFLFHLNLLSLQ